MKSLECDLAILAMQCDASKVAPTWILLNTSKSGHVQEGHPLFKDCMFVSGDDAAQHFPNIALNVSSCSRSLPGEPAHVANLR